MTQRKQGLGQIGTGAFDAELGLALRVFGLLNLDEDRRPGIVTLALRVHLQPGSLYGAFESKEGLFLAALDHYAAHSAAGLRTALDAAPDPLTGILDFFDGLTGGGSETTRRGCLLVNTVLEVGRNRDDGSRWNQN